MCGGTGAWSKPYQEAGYDVRNITLPDYDVEKVEFNILSLIFWGKKHKSQIFYENIYGILAAPPCTMFSFARTNAKKPRDLKQGIRTVEACLKIIWGCQYMLDSDQQKYPPLKFWALENPYFGMLRWFLGKPALVFDPYEFGDNYKKRTALWGHFNEPKKNPIEMTKEMIEKCKTNSRPLPKFDYMRSKDIHPEYYKKLDRQTRRAITPRGFAEAFYRANK